MSRHQAARDPLGPFRITQDSLLHQALTRLIVVFVLVRRLRGPYLLALAGVGLVCLALASFFVGVMS